MSRAGNNFGKASALRDNLSPRLVMIAIFSCMGAFTFGYDNGWWGGVLGQSYFNDVYGTQKVTNAVTGAVSYTLTASQQSAGTALGTAFIAIGCMVAGAVADRIGRVKSFYVTALGSIVGVLIQITSGINGGRFWQLVVGKMIICISIGVAAVSVPLYLAETSPAPIRGALVNSYVWVQSVGGFIANVVLYSVLNYTDQRVWVIPISLQLLAPVVTLCVAHTLPESPRWLVEKGRIGEARAALLDIRKGKTDYDVEEDLVSLQAAFDQTSSREKITWMQCFKGRDGFRTSICAGVQCLQQGQGLSFMANYLVIFLIQLGIPNPYLILVIVYSFLVPFTAAGFYVQDYFGRRFLLIAGGTVMGACLIGVAIITTITPNPVGGASTACVALIALWLVAFTQSWTNIPWTVSAELPSDVARDKTLAIGAFGGFVSGMMVSLINPYMQNAEYGDLGGRVGFVYGAMSVVAVVWVWYFVPELKGRTLEEVDYMFDSRIPLRKMGRYTIDKSQLPQGLNALASDDVNHYSANGGSDENDKKMDTKHID